MVTAAGRLARQQLRWRLPVVQHAEGLHRHRPVVDRRGGWAAAAEVTGGTGGRSGGCAHGLRLGSQPPGLLRVGARLEVVDGTRSGLKPGQQEALLPCSVGPPASHTLSQGTALRQPSCETEIDVRATDLHTRIHDRDNRPRAGWPWLARAMLRGQQCAVGPLTAQRHVLLRRGRVRQQHGLLQLDAPREVGHLLAPLGGVRLGRPALVLPLPCVITVSQPAA
jgi:hypothetical protein